MKHSILLVITLFIGACLATSQSIPWTPQSAGELKRVVINVPQAFQSLGLVRGTNDVFLPEGWSAQIFFAGQQLGKPRFMAFGPDSVLFVANMNKNNVLALPDKNNDGIADEAIVAANVSAYCHDVRFYRDTMYVCQESGVTKLWRSDPTKYVFDQRQVVIDKGSQTNQTGGNHRTRTLVLDSINRKIYVSVGSRGNADRESDRAVIEQYNWDGSERRVYSNGVRNAVGMALHPRTGKLWANNNGSDLQGNDVPPEWVDIVRDGSFYGYPYAYHTQNFFDLNQSSYADLKPLTAADSANVAKMVSPAALVTAHSAPMALEFSHAGMPDGYRKGAFMALRGSWNRMPLSGSKIVYLDFDDDADTIANVSVDFCRGFLNDSNNQASRWARPVGLALAADGKIYVTSDDLKQFVLLLTPPTSTSVDEPSSEDLQLRTTINEAGIEVELPQHWTSASISMVDLEGRLIQEVQASGRTRLDPSAISSGVYVITARHNGHLLTSTITIAR